MSPPTIAPVFDDVLAAAARIAPHAHATPVHRSRTLDGIAGCTLHFKGEHLQRGGAFKFRGACNAVWSLDPGQAARGVVTHSSGNHGGALALAARTRGIACHVVVPENASPAKMAAIAAYGGVLHRCEPTQAAREAACQELQDETGAELVHPYADPRVMAGQGTAALELVAAAGPLDALVVPISGGGLSAGSAIALSGVSPATRLYLAEPASGADTAASFARGERVTGLVPDTICDGLRATMGQPNFELLQAAGARVLTVEDADTLAAMRLLWQRLKQLVEPSSAIAFAAALHNGEAFAGKRVGVILSGGNVAPEVLRMAGEGA